MSVPSNCVSCGRELYTNPPIKEIKCEQCEEIERLQKFIENLHVVHFVELQREKATVERYEKALKQIDNILDKNMYSRTLEKIGGVVCEALMRKEPNT